MGQIDNDAGGCAAGIILGTVTFLGVVVIALHPHATSSGPNLAEMVSGSARAQAASAMVHGMKISLIISWILDLSVLATRVGQQRLWVRAGLIVYVMGGLIAIGAALINGFVVPEASGLYRIRTGAGTPAEIATLLWAMNQALTICGIIIMSTGIAFLSATLLPLKSRMVSLAAAPVY